MSPRAGGGETPVEWSCATRWCTRPRWGYEEKQHVSDVATLVTALAFQLTGAPTSISAASVRRLEAELLEYSGR
ncbi:hypothetical protein NDU88_000930 [Pleurodeles waltl]|uniref:Uncharacterized protein n=1 Tax=Pleurodeles waltl TaxID=8319 RepID=A0AAV7URE4_PLEWA|nr:hypothetical protein NDU88_000930 [Pleurodeles waltl]